VSKQQCFRQNPAIRFVWTIVPTVLFILCSVPTVWAYKAHQYKQKRDEDWKEYKKKHFIIYYKEAPMGFVKNVEEAAEQYYQEITKNLGFTRYKGWTWNDRARIYIYDDREDYVESGKVVRWSHGMASPKTKVIRTFPAAHGFFDTTLPHELGHIIFREFVGFKARVPLWFEEGIAMYQEKAQRWGADRRVREALEDGRFIPLKDLALMRLTTRTPSDEVDLFYTEAASLVRFILDQQGRQRFARLCRELKKGDPFDWTFAYVYVRFKTMDDLNKAWVDYLKSR